MTGNKKAAEVGKPQAASKSFSETHFNLILYRLKTAVYRMTHWLFFMGALHG